MKDFLAKHKYKIAYISCLVLAVYIGYFLSLPVSPTTEAGYMLYFGKFLVAVALVCLGIYFRTKDVSQK